MLEWESREGAVRVLVDTSTDLRQQALRAGIDRLDAVIYTHAHADHILGLDELRIYNFVYHRPMPLYGDAETLARIRQMFWYAFDKKAIAVPRLDLHEIDEQFDLFGVRIDAVPVEHGAMSVHAFRVGDFAYVTDCSGISPDAAVRLQDLDVLVIDALRHKPHRSHFSLEQALREVERLRPRRALLTHLSHDLEHAHLSGSLPPGIEVAHDGLVLELTLPESCRCD